MLKIAVVDNPTVVDACSTENPANIPIHLILSETTLATSSSLIVLVYLFFGGGLRKTHVFWNIMAVKVIQGRRFWHHISLVNFILVLHGRQAGLVIFKRFFQAFWFLFILWFVKFSVWISVLEKLAGPYSSVYESTLIPPKTRQCKEAKTVTVVESGERESFFLGEGLQQ